MKTLLYVVISLPLVLLFFKFTFFPDETSPPKRLPEITKSVTISKTPKFMKITSSAFEHQQKIPSRYTCVGENVNPPLIFSEVPKETRTLALIVDDPDAPVGTWVHWVIFNMEPRTLGIAENTKPTSGTEGINSFGKLGYGGPCPPSGTHRYFFKLYALDNQLDLTAAADKKMVENAMKGHILQQAELVGLFSK